MVRSDVPAASSHQPSATPSALNHRFSSIYCKMIASSRRRFRTTNLAIIVFIGALHSFGSQATAFSSHCSRAADVRPQQKLHVSTTSDDTKLDVLIDDVPPCLYKAHDNRWKPRVELKSLRIGQRLIGVAINGTELLEAKTGPKCKSRI